MKHGELLKKFAEDQRIDLKTSQRILDALYESALDVTNLNRVLWRLESYLIKENIKTLMQKSSDELIKQMIQEIVMEDAEHDCEICESREVCCHEKKPTGQAFAELGDAVSTWIFSGVPEGMFKEMKEGDVVDIQIMRKGKWSHPLYGEVVVDNKVIDDVVENFKTNKRGVELAVDDNHESNHRALAWFKEVYKQGKDAVWAKLALTKRGAELLTEGAYKYFSPEIVFRKNDEETNEEIQNLLVGGAFTNRPFFKAMAPLMASEDVANLSTEHNPARFQFQSFNTPNMKKLFALLEKYSGQDKITLSEKKSLEKAFNELGEDDKEGARPIVNEQLAKFSEGEGEDKAEVIDGEGTDTTDEPSKADDAAQDGEKQDDADKSDEDTDATGDEEKEPKAKAEDTTTIVETPELEGIKANEDGTYTLQASELEAFKKMAQTNSQLIRQKRLQMAGTKMKTMAFSESNPTGIVLPKTQQSIVNFATSLSESQEKVFWDIVGQFKSVAASEIGHNKQGAPAKLFNEEDKAFYVKNMKYSEADAEKLAIAAFAAEKQKMAKKV